MIRYPINLTLLLLTLPLGMARANDDVLTTSSDGAMLTRKLVIQSLPTKEGCVLVTDPYIGKWYECNGRRVTQIAEGPYEFFLDFDIVGGKYVVWKFVEEKGFEQYEAYYSNDYSGSPVGIRQLSQKAKVEFDELEELAAPSGGRDERVTYYFYDGNTRVEAYFYSCTRQFPSQVGITGYWPRHSIDNFAVTGDRATWLLDGEEQEKLLPTCVSTPPPSTYVIEPTDDAFVTENQPDVTNPYTQILRVRTATGLGRHTYLRFEVTGLPSGSDVLSATLKVRTRTQSIPDLGIWYVTDQAFSDSWREETLTWRNASQQAVQIGMMYSLAPYTWYSLDVSSVVNGNGVYTIGLATNQNLTGLGFSSKEVPGQEPRLELVVE